MKKGFSIIELIVTIAVIIILGIAFTVVLKSGIDGSNQGTISTINIAEASYPEATNYAVDVAGVLSADQLASLNNSLKELDGKQQIGVAIVKTTSPLSIEQYGIKLAEKWKVGRAGLDNGAVIIIATEDRKVRIEVGRGLEGDIPDAVAGRIIDEYMIPDLKKGDWFGAVVHGIAGISSKVQ